MNRSDLVQAWAREVGLDPQALRQAQQVCAFVVLDRFEVSIEWPEASDDLFVLIDIIDSHGGELRHKRLARAMQLNAFGLVTRGASLGWDEITDRIGLSYRISGEGLDVAGLNNLVVNLVEVAQYAYGELRFENDEVQVAQIRNTAQWFAPLQA